MVQYLTLRVTSVIILPMLSSVLILNGLFVIMYLIHNLKTSVPFFSIDTGTYSKPCNFIPGLLIKSLCYSLCYSPGFFFISQFLILSLPFLNLIQDIAQTSHWISRSTTCHFHWNSQFGANLFTVLQIPQDWSILFSLFLEIPSFQGTFFLIIYFHSMSLTM